MVNEENINKIESNHESKRIGFLAALKAMFLNEDEEVEKDIQEEVELLNAESEKNIKNLENKILSEKNQKRERLSKDLKVNISETTVQTTGRKVQKNIKRDDEELEK